MNREILFRGKRVDNGEWTYGYLVKSITSWGKTIATLFTDIFTIEVDADTVGQYTDLTDVNGKKIYEGDIVQEEALVDYMTLVGGKARKYVVKYGVHKIPCCGCFDDYHKTVGFYFQDYENPKEEMEIGENDIDGLIVIGNVYDNRDLLKGECKCTT